MTFREPARESNTDVTEIVPTALHEEPEAPVLVEEHEEEELPPVSEEALTPLPAISPQVKRALVRVYPGSAVNGVRVSAFCDMYWMVWPYIS